MNHNEAARKVIIKAMTDFVQGDSGTFEQGTDFILTALSDAGLVITDGWIDVKDRLPEKNGFYFTWCEKPSEPGLIFYNTEAGWQNGFYDGKVMLLKDGVKPKDCVFLDMEISRGDIRSLGHHMLLLNKNSKPVTWDSKFKNCI